MAEMNPLRRRMIEDMTVWIRHCVAHHRQHGTWLAATTFPARTGSSIPCRATAPKTWPRTDYERLDPAQNYAEWRGITFRARVAKIVREVVPYKLRDRIEGLLDGLRSRGAAASAPEAVRPPERESAGTETPRSAATPARELTEELRRTRTEALKRHAAPWPRSSPLRIQMVRAVQTRCAN